MSIDRADLTLVLATPTLKEAHTQACFGHLPWSEGMTFEVGHRITLSKCPACNDQAFETLVRRELEEGEWAKHGRDLTWCLIDRNRPDEMFSGCETHLTATLIKRKGSERVEEGWMYGVTSLITPEQYRGRGYARHLLQLLHYALADASVVPPFPAEWGTPPRLTRKQRRMVPYAAGSYLWSDIGPDLYASCRVGLGGPGWEIAPQDQHEVTWRTAPSPGGQSIDDAALARGWKVLHRRDMPPITARLARSARERLEIDDSSTASLLQLDPASAGTLTFSHKRMDFIENPPWRLERDVEPMGLAKGDTVVLFTRWSCHMPDALLVTYVHELRAEDLRSLVGVLEAIADGTGAEQIVAWDLDPEGQVVKELCAVRGAKASLRHGQDAHLFAKFYYDGLSRGDEGVMLDKQLWTWS